VSVVLRIESLTPVNLVTSVSLEGMESPPLRPSEVVVDSDALNEVGSDMSVA
jgi:hypothetical protein